MDDDHTRVTIITSKTEQSSNTPWALFQTTLQNKHLIWHLARRDIEARYRGSVLGLLWAVFVPILMLAVYTFVFSVVFKARWNVSIGNRGNFALLLFSGLILFNIFAECVGNAPRLMTANVSYIKKVVFPIQILPVVMIIGAVFNAAISFLVLVIAYFCMIGIPPLTILLVPVLVFPLILFTLGLTWILASLGVYFRDIQQFIGVLVMILMFMSPIFYPLSAIPEKLRAFVMLSPITVAIEEFRALLFVGGIPNFWIWGLYALLSWGIAWGGYLWFMKTRKGFADVI